MNVSVFCFLASYVVTIALEAIRLRGRYTINRIAIKVVATAGLLAHSFYLYNRSQAANLPPLLSSTHDWLLVLAWLVVLLYLFVTLFDSNLAIGLFLLPIVLGLIAAAYFVHQTPNQLIASSEALGLQARRGWAMLHASLLVLGMAAGVMALVLGMMYLFQHSRLRHKQVMTEGMSLPSLARLARLNWWSVIVSVPLLTLGMAVGAGLGFWPKHGTEPLRWNDPVIASYGIAWLVMFGFFVWLLATRRAPEKQIASLTIWAFGFLLISIVALQIISTRTSISLHAAASVDAKAVANGATPLAFEEGRG